MNLTVLYVLGFVVITVGMYYGYDFLKKKKIVTDEDVKTIASALGLAVSVVLQLDLKQSPQIKKAYTYINSAIEYVLKESKVTDKLQLEQDITNYCYQLCEQAGLVLNDNLKNIIAQLIELSMNNKYADKVNSLFPTPTIDTTK